MLSALLFFGGALDLGVNAVPSEHSIEASIFCTGTFVSRGNCNTWSSTAAGEGAGALLKVQQKLNHGTLRDEDVKLFIRAYDAIPKLLRRASNLARLSPQEGAKLTSARVAMCLVLSELFKQLGWSHFQCAG